MGNAVCLGLARAAAPLGASLLLLAPKLAAACAVCSSGRDDETRQAFIDTTVLLTFLPLLMIGGVLLWIRRRYLEQQAQELEARRGRAAAPVVSG